MMKSSLLMFCVLVGTLCGAEAQDTPVDNATSEAWRSDLDFMVGELEIRHADLYHSISIEDFAAQIDAFKEALPELTHAERIGELARIIALIGDGHTGVFPWNRGVDGARLPLELFKTKEGFMIIRAPAEHAGLIGGLLLSIGGRPAEETAAALTPLIPRDNRWTVDNLQQDYLLVPVFLKAVGVAVGESDSVELDVLLPDGKRELRMLSPIARSAWRDVNKADPAFVPMWQRNLDTAYWFSILSDSQTAFVQYNRADIDMEEESTAEFADRLIRTIEEQNIERLIIDLRWNRGGNIWRARHLVHAVIRSESINRRGQVFVLIRHNNFSAATLTALAFETHTEAIFIGGPTGGKPISYGYLRFFTLPHTGVQIRYSTARTMGENPHDTRPAVFPDIPVSFTREAFLAGRDPDLDAALNWKERIPASDILAQAYEQGGIDAAIVRWTELFEQQMEYDCGPAQLNRFGYALLREEKTADAVRIFEKNVKIYPWYASLWDSLGEALLAEGKRYAAAEAYKRAFELNGEFTRWRELATEREQKVQ